MEHAQRTAFLLSEILSNTSSTFLALMIVNIATTMFSPQGGSQHQIEDFLPRRGEEEDGGSPKSIPKLQTRNSPLNLSQLLMGKPSDMIRRLVFHQFLLVVNAMDE